MNQYIIATLLALLAAPPLIGRGEVAGDKPAVEAGREALRSRSDLPWYDGERDAIQRIDVYPPSDVAARKSKWQLPNRQWPDWMGPLLEVLGWLVLGLFLGLLVYVLVKALITVSGNWRPGTSVSGEADPLQGDVDRIESLPFQLNTSQTDLLAQARRYYESGQFGQAIIFFYSYQLVQLDRHRLIRLAKGKTNRQYLREIRSRRELWDLLSRSMIAFEDVFFGHHVLDRDRFESCWQRLDDFHQDLARTFE